MDNSNLSKIISTNDQKKKMDDLSKYVDEIVNTKNEQGLSSFLDYCMFLF